MTVLRNLSILRKGFAKHLINFNETQCHTLWGYVAIAFNRVDADRLNLVGPDRLCAEWVLKNGGAISTIDAPHRLIKNYNTLPSEDVKFKIKVIDGSASSVMKIGLEHFRGCSHIDTVIFHQCSHLESDGLQGLVHLKNTLTELQVSECDNISDDGLMVIENMNNLKILRIFNMRYVKDLEMIKTKLSKSLPNCHIDTKKTMSDK